MNPLQGHIGHLLAGAGSIETLATVLSLERGELPHTLNLMKSDCARIRHVQKGEKMERNGGEILFIISDSHEDVEHCDSSSSISDNPSLDGCALVNSSGFGGTNAVLLLQKYRP